MNLRPDSPLGVYVHFPFCTSVCPYCDFAVEARKVLPHAAYADAVLAELDAKASDFAGRRAQTLYFGGGTPSLWRAEDLARVVAAVRARFDLVRDAEVTLEVNPEGIGEAEVSAWVEAGITRVSIGAQSSDPGALRLLGRHHGPEDSARVVALCRAAGMQSISLDLIFSLPSQTLASLDRELDALLGHQPDHLSAYVLTIEERTPFFALRKQGRLSIPDDEDAASLYEHARARIEAAGLAHYELSSYARAGHASRHNSSYWRLVDYLGLGASAHSLQLLSDGSARRFWNARATDAYLSSAASVAEERLSPAALEREALWLGLRLLEGVDLDAHSARFGSDPRKTDAARLSRLSAAGLLSLSNGRLRLTDKGLLLHDAVAAEFVGTEQKR